MASIQEKIILVAGTFIGSIIGIQVVSLLLSTLFPSLTLLKLGPVISLALIGLIVVGTFSLIIGKSFGSLKTGDAVLIMIALFGLILFVFQAPNILPNLFDAQALMSLLGA